MLALQLITCRAPMLEYKAPTPIVALGAERFFSSDSGDQTLLDNGCFTSAMRSTLSSSYFANPCVHCRKLQGGFFIIEEVDSPFFPDMETGRIKAKIAQMELPFDYFLRGDWVSQTSDQS